jgi:glutamate-1-semialdehyde 2,1-aminomutase
MQIPQEIARVEMLYGSLIVALSFFLQNLNIVTSKTIYKNSSLLCHISTIYIRIIRNMKDKVSENLFDRATASIPGGVNSPVRAFGAVGGTPQFIDRAQGAYLWNVDKRRYIDYVGSWGPMILGHGDPKVLLALQTQLTKGVSFGAPTELEVQLAELLCTKLPYLEMVRLVNSGTEAVMSAIRVARGFTGRSKIIKFAGCYHGHSDGLLVAAGSGAATLGVPNSAGVTPSQVADTIVANFNDFNGTRKLIQELNADLAAVIVEPLAGNMGLVEPQSGFLEMLREETQKRGAVLIFDEVMSGFRVSSGGYQKLCGVTPDVVTLGKIIGGGLPVGAYGGRREIMEKIAPSGAVYQAGTLSGNPLAVTAGLATLNQLDDALYQRLENLGQRLETGLREVLEEKQIPAQLHRVGSMWTLFFTPDPVTDYASAAQSDTERFGKYFHAMLERGIYLPPSQFESAFISAAHTEDDIDQTITAARESLSNV